MTSTMHFAVLALSCLALASAAPEGSASFQPSAASSNYVQQAAPAPSAPLQQYPSSYGYSEPLQQSPSGAGYSVQTGYEGYLVPQEHHQDEGLFPALGGLLPGRSTILTLLPKAGHLAGKVAILLLGSAALLFVGTVFTLGVCTFTPICKLTLFGFPFFKDSVRSFITPDRLTQMTIFVRQAIDKYRDMQNEDQRALKAVKAS